MNRFPSSAQLGKLKIVMGMRVRRAHKLYQEKLQEWRDARRKVEEQREDVAVLDNDLQRVIDYMGRDDVMRDPGKLQLGVSRRHWTIYDREKAQYYLEVAEGDLKKASDELDEQKRFWLKAVARESKLEEQCFEAHSNEEREQERRDELEREDATGLQAKDSFGRTC